jgi:hypothetical protein
VYGDTNLQQTLGSMSITTTPTAFNVEADVTVDCNNKITFMIGLQNVNGKNVFLRNVRAYRMGAGDLIVDGSIKTGHLAASSVSTVKLAADAVVANKIAANAVDVSKLNISDLTNYVADGDFSDPTSANWDMVTSAPMLTRVDSVGALPYMEGNALSSRYTLWKNANRFEINAGDEFFVQMEVQTPATNVDTLVFTPALEVFDVDGASVGFKGVATAVSVAPNTDWVLVDGVIQIDTPTTFASAIFNPYVAPSTTANQKFRIRRASLRKRANGRLIVDGSILAPHIAAEAITADHLQAGAVTADTIVSELNWTTEQYVGQIHIHPTQGITIPQDGTEDVTHLAADGSGNAFAGGIIANDGLTSYGGINMQGTDNFLAGELKAGSGVNDPSTAPTVTSSYDTVTVGGGLDPGFYRKGLCEFHDGAAANWVTTDTFPGAGSDVQAWSKAGGPAFWNFSVLSGWQSYGGVTRIAGYYYVLARQLSAPTNWKILIYRGSDKAYMGSYFTGPGGVGSITTTSYPSIGTDGTYLFVAFANAGDIFVRKFNPYGVAGAGDQVGSSMNGGAWGASVHVQGVQGVGGKIFVAYNNGIYAYTPGATTMTRDTASEFPKNVGALAGISHDGTSWATFNSGTTWTKHTALSGRYLFAYDFRDADPLGSGTANTKPSPTKDITPVKFAKWTVTVPQSPPDDLTTDGANTCRIFASPYGSPLVFQHQLVTDGDGVSGKPLSYIKTFSTLSPTGAAPNSVNDFASRPTSAIGRHSSSKTDGSDPMWKLDGDGSWKLGAFLKGNADGTDALDSGWINVTKAAIMTSGTLRYRIKSGLITIQFDGAASTTNGQTARLDAAAIPTAYRPSVQARGICYMGGFAATCNIGTDGTINVINNTGATRASVAGVVVYPIG